MTAIINSRQRRDVAYTENAGGGFEPQVAGMSASHLVKKRPGTWRDRASNRRRSRAQEGLGCPRRERCEQHDREEQR